LHIAPSIPSNYTATTAIAYSFCQETQIEQNIQLLIKRMEGSGEKGLALCEIEGREM